MSKWKSERDEEARPLVQALTIANREICEFITELNVLAQDSEGQYAKGLEYCRAHRTHEWAASDHLVVQKFHQLHSAFRSARVLLRTMGEKAGADVEPPCQTALIDATERIPGVLNAGVPGAGGVDAIFVLLLTPTAREDVERLWADWVDPSTSGPRIVYVCPLLLSAAAAELSGIRVESLGWD